MMGSGVRRCVRFCLSERDVEELTAQRGVILTDEAVRLWGRTCGQADAHQVRRQRPPVKTCPRGRSARGSRTSAPSTGGTPQDDLGGPGHARCRWSADAHQAERCWHFALARRQQAKSWELRAAMSLSRRCSGKVRGTRLGSYWCRSTAGSPRASTPPTSGKPERCSKSCPDRAPMPLPVSKEPTAAGP
jgi:hypothetical protein